MAVATMILAAIFGVGGLTAFIAGVTGARWFFSSAGSRAFTGRRHRLTARILYSLAGLTMMALSALLLKG